MSATPPRVGGGRHLPVLAPHPTAVAVGIPARDEADRIEACVRSVVAAVRHLRRPAAIVVAADRCRDATAAVAAAALRHAGPDVVTAVVPVEHGCVGPARQAACAHAVSVLDRPPERIWLATTDADTVVGPTWLADQWRWVARGADGVAGLVEVDTWHHLQPAARQRWLSLVDGADGGRAFGHGHVHGANLGIRASVWARSGGFPARASAEEHALWRAARAGGAWLVGAPDVVVRTSGRLDGRAPDGFADLLAALSEPA
jgi:cellulose synthase/poly-beta-1,6-N-acetylglucosamine synthase-like glycosyltransferase